jgi:hypothetical protein
MGWISYAAHGGVGLMQMGNNVWRAFGYNSRLQTERILDVVNNDIGQTLLDQGFDWGTGNNNGNLNEVYTNHGGPGYPQLLAFHDYYLYDGLNRVSAANSKKVRVGESEQLMWAENYGYDRYGNRWMASTGGLPASGLTPTVDVYNSANRMNATQYD